MPETIRLENTLYAVEIETAHGTLCRLTDKLGGSELIAEPRLADNFRLLLPLPGVDCNYLFGCEQALTSYDFTADRVQLCWQGPLHNARGSFDLDVTLWIELTGDTVQFRCEVRNGTAYRLAEVWYAMLGGLLGLGAGEARQETRAMLPEASAWDQPLFRDFGNTRGQTLGVTGAEHSFSYPGSLGMPWMSLYNPAIDRAVFFAALEETPRVKLIRLYLDPGTAERRPGGNWPRPDEAGAFPRGVTMNWTHVPYTGSGETFRGAPVILQCHAGGWRESAALYREWFSAHFPVVTPGEGWMRTETALHHLMLMLPEDNINLRYPEIPALAASVKAHGVEHLMLAGWQVGGHDRGYPYYEPDPRLGSWEELEAGIRGAHAHGVKVSFFVNCQPIDMTTEWYKRELHRYRILDPYGEQYYIVNYWGMGTLSARSRFFTARPFTEMNPAHPEVRALLIRQFARLVEIGADGLHIDKFFQTPMDFNPRLTWTSPDRAHHEGILLFVEELLAACRAINPAFSFSYEGGWDRLFSYTDVGWWGPRDDLLKAVFPQRALTTGVEQPYDYAKANEAVLGGCNFLIGPGNYTQTMDYPPMQPLLAYLAEITRIRQALLAVVSFGAMADASDGIFRQRRPLLQMHGPFAESALGRWTVFQESNTGRRAAILGNFGTASLRVEAMGFRDRPGGACRLYRAFAPALETAFPLTTEVPGEQVVFIVED